MPIDAFMDQHVNCIDQCTASRDAVTGSQVTKRGPTTISIAPLEDSLGDVDWWQMKVC